MKSLIITTSFALLFSGVAFGYDLGSINPTREKNENLTVDTLKRRISKVWNSEVFWKQDISLETFEKEAMQIRETVAVIIKQQPLKVIENGNYADFTELQRRKIFIQNHDDKSGIPQSFYKLLDVIDLNGPLLGKLDAAEISNFFNAYLRMTYYRAGKTQPTSIEESKYALNHLKDERVKSAYLGPKVFTQNRYHMIDSTMRDLIKDINKLSKDEAFKKKVNENDVFYTAITPGKTVTDFRLPDRNGKMVKLSDYKGKAVIIDVWATWCSACIANLPYFEGIADEFKDRKDVVFINIGWENDGDKPKWLKFLTDKKLHGIQLIAERTEKNGIDQQDGLRDKLRITGIPRYIFIDKQGKIVESFGPYPSKPGFRELVQKTITK